MSALTVQEGGSHYKDLAIQPVEYIHANGIGFMEGCVIKYVTRWRAKGGLEDLRKARHFIDLLMDLETRAAAGAPQFPPISAEGTGEAVAQAAEPQVSRLHIGTFHDLFRGGLPSPTPEAP